MILLDANVIIWWMAGDQRLGSDAKQLLAATESELSVSLLTLFEIELKCRINKLSLQIPVGDFLDTYGIEVYSPTANELTSIMKIEIIHTAPFDCALIGLAKLKSWIVMTSDRVLQEVAGDLAVVINSRK